MMNTPLYFRRSQDVAARHFGDELMIMSGKTSALFSLNETASLLWNSADGVTPLTEAVEREICAHFDVDRDSALADATDVLNDLARHGILEVADHPLPHQSAAQP